jgi:hypothetical protein
VTSNVAKAPKCCKKRQYWIHQGLGVKRGELVIFRHYFTLLDSQKWWKIRVIAAFSLKICATCKFGINICDNISNWRDHLLVCHQIWALSRVWHQFTLKPNFYMSNSGGCASLKCCDSIYAKLLTVATSNTDAIGTIALIPLMSHLCTKIYNGVTSRKLTKKRVIFYDDFDDSRKCLTITSRKTVYFSRLICFVYNSVATFSTNFCRNNTVNAYKMSLLWN